MHFVHHLTCPCICRRQNARGTGTGPFGRSAEVLQLLVQVASSQDRLSNFKGGKKLITTAEKDAADAVCLPSFTWLWGHSLSKKYL